jgi:hypothetical protein
VEVSDPGETSSTKSAAASSAAAAPTLAAAAASAGGDSEACADEIVGDEGGRFRLFRLASARGGDGGV